MPADWLSGQEASDEEVHIPTIRCEPSKAYQQTPLQKRNPDHPESEPGSSSSRPHRWLDLGLVCTALAIGFMHSNFLF